MCISHSGKLPIYRISRNGHLPIVDVDQVEAIKPAISSNEPDRYHVYEISADPLPSEDGNGVGTETRTKLVQLAERRLSIFSGPTLQSASLYAHSDAFPQICCQLGVKHANASRDGNGDAIKSLSDDARRAHNTKAGTPTTSSA